MNIVSYDLREKMNITSLDLPRDVSEFDIAKIEQKASTIVAPKLVKDAPISLECSYFQSVQLPTPNAKKFINRMVIGYVVGIHVCSSVVDERGLIDIKKFKPLARMGYQGYVVVDECFDMPRADLSR